jgi:hypothetical protein
VSRRLQPRGEEGIALALTLLVMAVSSAVLVSVIQYTSSTGRDAKSNHARQTAYGLAEAGLNYALSVLANAADPTSPTILPATTVQLTGGSATYSGTLAAPTWTLTGVGRVPNPGGPGMPAVTRTVTRQVSMNGLSVGSFSGLWDRIYSDLDWWSCSVTVNPGMNIPSNFAARGDVCLNSSSITGATTNVEIGGKVTINAARSGLGLPSAATGWTNPTNVFTDNNVWATNAITATLDGANLDSTGFGFSIPATAVIDGISVEVERKASASSTLKDGSVSLLKSGSPAGTNKAGTSFWSTSNTKVTYGSASDLWGTTWTPAEINASNFGLRFRAHNHHASTASTASIDYVQITVTYTDGALGIGTAGTPVARADIVGTCQWGTQTAHTPCSATDHVWANTITTTAPTLSRPTINWQYWYDHAALGPKHPCTTSSGTPPAFDNNTTYDGTNADQELTPEGVGKSYTCQAKNASGAVIGELSWNNTTRVLTVQGTIFFDGDAEFHDHDVAAWHYRGRGVIYIADDWHNDERVCAGSAATDCRATGMPSWNTNTDLLVLVIGGKRGWGNDFDFHRDAAFQGAIYAKNACKLTDTAYMQGPLNCGWLDFDGNAPTFFPWPPLPSSATGQIYTTGTSSDIQLILGAQTG